MIVDIRSEINAAPYIRPGIWYDRRGRDGITGVTIHYTAARPAAGVYAVATYQVGPTAQEAFPAIAYHLFVEEDGTVYLCHDLETRVWHSGAAVDGVARNRSHVGICYAGNVEPNVAQLEGLREAIVWCEAELGRSLSIEGHRDAPYASACPGPTWPAWRLAMLPRGKGMSEAEVLAAKVLSVERVRLALAHFRTGWAIQSGAAPQIRRAMRRGATYAHRIATAAGAFKQGINLLEAELDEPLTD